MKLRRTTLLLGFSVLAVLVVGTGVFLVAGSAIDLAGLRAAAKEYKAQGLPFLAKDVMTRRVRPQDNAAPLIRQLHSLIPPKKFGDALSKAVDRQDWKAAGLALEHYKPALEIAQQAAERPCLDFERDWDLGAAISRICGLQTCRESPECQGRH